MKAKKTVLANGLRIVSVALPNNPTATVMVLVEAGSHYESKKQNGIAHFLEHMCFKGTTHRTGRVLNQELDALGVRTNAFTSHEMTGYFAKGRVALVPKILEIISDIYINPTFPKDELEREKGVVMGEIDMYSDMPKSRAGQAFLQLVYKDQPAGKPITGTKETVRSFTQKDLISFKNKHYVPSATTIVIAGDVNHASLVRMIRTYFGKLQDAPRIHKKKVIPKKSVERFVVERKKTDQAHIVLGYKTVPLHHPDRYALDMCAALLGAGMSSRLFVRIREELGAGYYVGSSHASETDTGLFVVRVGTENTRAEEIINEILQEIATLAYQPIPEEELEKTKQFVIGNFEMGLESSDDVADFFGIQEILRQEKEDPKKVIRMIKKITTRDIQRVARRYCTIKNVHVAVVGDVTLSSSLRKQLTN